MDVSLKKKKQQLRINFLLKSSQANTVNLCQCRSAINALTASINTFYRCDNPHVGQSEKYIFPT